MGRLDDLPPEVLELIIPAKHVMRMNCIGNKLFGCKLKQLKHLHIEDAGFLTRRIPKWPSALPEMRLVSFVFIAPVMALTFITPTILPTTLLDLKLHFPSVGAFVNGGGLRDICLRSLTLKDSTDFHEALQFEALPTSLVNLCLGLSWILPPSKMDTPLLESFTIEISSKSSYETLRKCLGQTTPSSIKDGMNALNMRLPDSLINLRFASENPTYSHMLDCIEKNVVAQSLPRSLVSIDWTGMFWHAQNVLLLPIKLQNLTIECSANDTLPLLPRYLTSLRICGSNKRIEMTVDGFWILLPTSLRSLDVRWNNRTLHDWCNFDLRHLLPNLEELWYPDLVFKGTTIWPLNMRKLMADSVDILPAGLEYLELRKPRHPLDQLQSSSLSNLELYLPVNDVFKHLQHMKNLTRLTICAGYNHVALENHFGSPLLPSIRNVEIIGCFRNHIGIFNYFPNTLEELRCGTSMVPASFIVGFTHLKRLVISVSEDSNLIQLPHSLEELDLTIPPMYKPTFRFSHLPPRLHSLTIDANPACISNSSFYVMDDLELLCFAKPVTISRSDVLKFFPRLKKLQECNESTTLPCDIVKDHYLVV